MFDLELALWGWWCGVWRLGWSMGAMAINTRSVEYQGSLPPIRAVMQSCTVVVQSCEGAESAPDPGQNPLGAPVVDFDPFFCQCTGTVNGTGVAVGIGVA